MLNKVYVCTSWNLKFNLYAFCEFVEQDGFEVPKHAKKPNETNIQLSWPNKLGH